MVRPEESEIRGKELQVVEASCCARPAGASPARVIAAEPVSRSPIRREIALSERGVKSPSSGGEQVRGSQHQVKPAALSYLQHASRATHVIAKTTYPSLQADEGGCCIGVWGVAREQGLERNRKEPSVQHNAALGKAPCGGHAAKAGKREGLDSRTAPKNPCGRERTDKVQQLQRQLWAAAKQREGRRFHALYGQICRNDILQEALETLRERGAQGGNHVLDADISDYFGSIGHDKLMTFIGQRVSDGRMLKLIRQWLQAGVMEAGETHPSKAATPQGSSSRWTAMWSGACEDCASSEQGAI